MFKRALMLCGLLSLSNPGITAPVALDSIAAVVNNNVITQAQVQQRVNTIEHQAQVNQAALPAIKELRQQVLDRLIDDILQVQYAKNLGLTVDDTNLNKAITNIAAQNHMSVAQMQQAVQKQGINFAQYREEIRKQILLNQLQAREVGNTIKISDQEINDLMGVLAKQPLPATQYRVQDFLIPIPEQASNEQIQASKLQANKLLTALRNSQQISPPPLVADLGWRSAKQLPDAFVSITQRLQPGDLSDPILTDNGYHIIRLLAVQNPSVNVASVKTHARHILIKTNAVTSDLDARARLQELRQSIIHGEDFAKVATVNSQDPGSAVKGGDLGWSKPGMYDPNFEKVMDQLEPQQISQPFATPFGWHIVQVLAREKSHDNKEFLREKARQIIYRRKFEEAVHNWVLQLRSNAYIKITAEG